MRKDIKEMSRPNWQKFLLALKEEYAEGKAEYESKNDNENEEVELPQSKYKARELYQKYQQWCSGSGERNVTTETKFFLSSKSSLDPPTRTKAGIFYDITTINISWAYYIYYNIPYNNKQWVAH